MYKIRNALHDYKSKSHPPKVSTTIQLNQARFYTKNAILVVQGLFVANPANFTRTIWKHCNSGCHIGLFDSQASQTFVHTAVIGGVA